MPRAVFEDAQYHLKDRTMNSHHRNYNILPSHLEFLTSDLLMLKNAQKMHGLVLPYDARTAMQEDHFREKSRK